MKIEDAKKCRCACIYRMRFPDGKAYVGQTRNLRDRIELYEKFGDKGVGKVAEAVGRYGMDSVDIDILSEVRGVQLSDLPVVLAVLEIKYIREEGSIWPAGYNVSIGGEVLGIPADVIQTRMGVSYNGQHKPVLVYNLEGEFVDEYESVQRCAYGLGIDENEVRSHVDKRDSLVRDMYMLRFKRYGGVPEKIIPFRPRKVEKVVHETKVVTRERERVVVRKKSPVLKYDESGHYCGMYESATEAAISIGVSAIRKGVLQRGYMFVDYDGGEIREEIGPIGRGDTRLPKYSAAVAAADDGTLSIDKVNKGWGRLINDFRVGQFGKDGELVRVFDSINEASHRTGLAYSNIWACVFGRTKTSGGYIWRRIPDDFKGTGQSENKQ